MCYYSLNGEGNRQPTLNLLTEPTMNQTMNPTADARNDAYADMDEEPIQDLDIELPSEEELEEEFVGIARMYLSERREDA